MNPFKNIIAEINIANIFNQLRHDIVKPTQLDLSYKHEKNVPSNIFMSSMKEYSLNYVHFTGLWWLLWARALVL